MRTIQQKTLPPKNLVIAMLAFLAVLIVIAIASIGVYISSTIGAFATCVLMVLPTLGVVAAVIVINSFA